MKSAIIVWQYVRNHAACLYMFHRCSRSRHETYMLHMLTVTRSTFMFVRTEQISRLRQSYMFRLSTTSTICRWRASNHDSPAMYDWLRDHVAARAPQTQPTLRRRPGFDHYCRLPSPGPSLIRRYAALPARRMVTANRSHRNG